MNWYKTARYLDTVKIKTPYGNGTKYVEVFIDPTRKEILQVADKQWKNGRGCLVGNNLYVWDAYILHSYMFEAMNFGRNAIPIEFYADKQGTIREIIITDMSSKTDWHENPDIRDAIMKNTGFQRVFEPDENSIGDSVSYYNDDIVGPWTELKNKIEQK